MAKKKIAETVTVNDIDRPYAMVVTEAQVFPFKDTAASPGHIKGLAEVVLNDALKIRGLRIMDGENGLFVAYPFDPFCKDGDYRSIVFPMTRELREHIENVVLEKYQATII